MGNNVVCLRHPQYKKENPPDLSCKVCCRKYVDNILEKQATLRENKGFNAYKWLEEKTKRQDNVSP